MLKLSIFFILLTGLITSISIWQIQLPVVQPTTKIEDNWNLPKLPQIDSVQQAYTKLNERHPWKVEEKKPAPPPPPTPEEAKKAAEPARPPPIDWQLVGIVQQGPRRYVLILDKNNKISQFSFKTALPNGARIVGIYDDFIEISNQGKIEMVRLYR